MPDEMDVIQAANEQFQADALADYRRNLPEPGRSQGAPPTHCIDCEEEIPERRRQAIKGCCRCVDCQIIIENQRSHV